MKEHPVEKMTFFENTLLPYRPGSASELHQLRVALTQGKAEGFAYIAKHPFEDLTRFDWLKQFPKTISAQAAEYKKVAETFVYLNQNWKSKTITLDELQQQFNLPLNSLNYVDAHLSHLMALKQVVQRLTTLSEQPFLLNLSDKERTGIETCLGIPISRLYELRGFTAPKAGKTPSDEELKSLSLISIQVLNILQSYPALQDKKGVFTAYFEVSAKQAKSKEMLQSFLNIEKPTNTLIQNIIEHPLFDDSLICGLLELKIDLTEDLLLVLVLTKKCKTKVQIDLLLKQGTLSETVLQALLSQSHLTETPLLQILARAKSDATMALISTHSNANQNVRNFILQHSLLSPKVLLMMLETKRFTDNELLLVLKHPTAVTQDVLEQVIKNESISSEVLLALLSHEKTSYGLIHQAISHAAFTPASGEYIILQKNISSDLLTVLALKAFERLEKEINSGWEEYLNQVFKRAKEMDSSPAIIAIIKQKREQISAKFGLEMFNQLGQDVLKHLPLLDMIQIADGEELGKLIKLETMKFPDELIIDDVIMGMAQRAQSTVHIDELLVRSEITSEIADILFKKAEYSGKIGNWNWLTEKQLLSTFKNTRDYDSLHRALTHPNLSPTVSQNWLDGISAQHKENKRLALTSKDPQEKLNLALDELKIKSYTHAIKAIRDKKYEEVAKTAFGLYQTLNLEFENYKRNPAEYAIQFKNNSQKAIDQAKPILQVHRGYKQIFLDIINIICSFAALFKKGSWRFFEAKTASLQVANKISENIDETIKEKREGSAPSV
jgi:hypothetical protein